MSARIRPDQVQVRLATPNVAFEQRVRQAFGHTLNGELRHLRQSLSGSVGPDAAVLAQDGPGVVALGPDLDPASALEVAARLDRDHPEITVLLIAEPTTDLLRDALRAGVRDVVSPGASDRGIAEAFTLARQAVAQRAGHGGGDEADAARIVSVLSPKGGSGKTTVATNLAVGLAELAPEQVVIVDADVQFGDVASALQLTPEHSVADAALAATDATLLKVFLTAHPSGLYALCAPDDPAAADDLTAEQVAEVIRLLADEFRYVIVDTPAGVDDHTLTACEHSTDLILLATMDVPSVRSLRKEVAALDHLGMTSQRRHFVLNRADSKVGLDADDVAATVGLPVDVALPSTRTVPVSTNVGNPVLTAEPASPVAQRLLDLVDRFTDQPVSRRTGGLFGWLRA